MRRIEVAGGSIAYDIAGNGAPLLFISGLNGRGSFWQNQIDAFSARFTMINFDHRGVGGSTGLPPYSIEQWAADAIRLLDRLDIPAAHLVGHSTGGVIAQVIASDYPDRVKSMVVGASWASPDERFRAVFELRKQVLTGLGGEAYARLGALLMAPLDEASTLGLRHASPDTPPSIIEARLDALLAHEAGARLRRVTCPTFVLAARDDILIPARMSRAVAEQIAGASWMLLPGGGHAFPRTRTAEYNRIVIDFLHTLEGSKTNKRSGALT